MAAHGAAARLPASPLPTGLSIDDEVREYEKILKLSEDIFSGTHPRLKVPQQFVRRPAPRHEPSGNLPDRHSPSTAKGKEPAIAPSSIKGPSGGPATSQSSHVAPKPPSEIDPIFLTKSEELVRAELQLQRGRVERALREQLEQRRQESKQKVALQDAKPDFDVSGVLNKALELVPPSPSSEAHGPTKAPSDSFDENSLYSSRAPDSPPSTRRKPSPPSGRSENLATDVPVNRYADELQRLEALNHSASDQEVQDTYTVAERRVPGCRKPYKTEEEYAPGRRPDVHQPVDALEEPEYSPPAPGVPPMERTDSREYQSSFANGPRRHEADYHYPDRRHYGRRSASPLGDLRVVRNHITSPAAPQPSRMSPLATAKGATVHRPNESRPLYDADRLGVERDLDRGSPEGPAPAARFMPKKRRRVQEERDAPRRVSSRRQAVDTSEPYIKQEPVSPPPFADDPPSGRSRMLQERPVYIDIASPRYTPVVERREPAIREAVYETEPYEVPVDPGVTRTASRLSVRRPVREDHDLRRVASLQYARHPEYPREYVERRSPRPMQPAPYSVIERAPEKARYYDEPAIAYSRRYVPVDEPAVSPSYRETYTDEDVFHRIIAPPHRRIVVDEHGHQYYEMPKLQAMPPPYARVSRSELYDDHVPLRQQSVRAGSVVQDPYSGRRYIQEMPPPTTTYRRVMDYARPATSDRRPYGMPLEEREAVPRGSSVQIGEYPARRATYIDEAEMPHERIVRMPSVRPGTSRYEEPREIVQHVENLPPGSRAVSTYMDDEPRRTRGYTERPAYPDVRARHERYW